jgi:hypothetical protein
MVAPSSFEASVTLDAYEGSTTLYRNIGDFLNYEIEKAIRSFKIS